jgi:hypothetical protein
MTAALLVGAGVFLATLVCYALATALIIHFVVYMNRIGFTGLGYWQNVAIMIIVSLLTAIAHLIQIGLWAIAFVLIGEFSSFQTAFYCSAQNYTALGYGDMILSERWRILGPLEAISGLLLFGLSTAVLFAIMNRLIQHRLGVQPGQPCDPAGKRDSVSPPPVHRPSGV